MEMNLLEMRNITKTFSGNKVLDDVSLTIQHGEVHALMGENGAGKSTLMKILMGMYSADGGTILLDGKKLQIDGPKQALETGIQMIHQELSPVLDMTVAENVYIGVTPTKGRLKLVDQRAMIEGTKAVLERVGLEVSPTVRMRSLSIAQMQLVEIAKAVSRNARLIIMDEPTSTLTEKETAVLFSQIRRLRAEGVSIIYISHKIEEIFGICDRVSILRDGRMVETIRVAEVNRDHLISRMVGRELEIIYPKREVPIGETLLEVRGLCWKDRVKDVSFSVRRGEILGVCGLVGAGRSETVSALFGVLKKDAGEILLNGKKVEIRTPAQAVALGMAYITEDRKATGLNLIGSIKHNISTVYLKKLTVNHLLNEKNEREAADRYINAMKIRTDSREKRVQLLSGGNQQKVAVSKWLLGDPELIIMDEPTRGIDVGAKRDIYMLMGELAAQGKAIIMISSEMPEVMGMADRIMVLADGRVTGFVERGEFDQERILGMQFA